MKILKRSLALITAAMTIILTSCDTLKSEYYPGTKTVIEGTDIGRESIWTFNEEVYYLHRIGSNDFVAATLDWNKSAGEYRSDTFPVVISKLGEDNWFLSAEGPDGLYSILRATPALDTSDGSWIISWLDPDRLEQDMEEGKVKADEDKDTYFLRGTKEEQDKYLLEKMDALFPAKHAAVARMIIEKERTEKPCKACGSKTDKIK